MIIKLLTDTMKHHNMAAIQCSLCTDSDWLPSRQTFLVMTGHYENFSRLDGSRVVSKTYEHVDENIKKYGQSITIFDNDNDISKN